MRTQAERITWEEACDMKKLCRFGNLHSLEKGGKDPERIGKRLGHLRTSTTGKKCSEA